MNPEAITELKRILALEPRILKPHEIEFLKARWPYVGKVSRAKFQDLIDGKLAKTDKGGDKGKAPKKPVDPDFNANAANTQTVDVDQDVEEDEGDGEIEPDGSTPSNNPFETVDEE